MVPKEKTFSSDLPPPDSSLPASCNGADNDVLVSPDFSSIVQQSSHKRKRSPESSSCSPGAIRRRRDSPPSSPPPTRLSASPAEAPTSPAPILTTPHSPSHMPYNPFSLPSPLPSPRTPSPPSEPPSPPDFSNDPPKSYKRLRSGKMVMSVTLDDFPRVVLMAKARGYMQDRGVVERHMYWVDSPNEQDCLWVLGGQQILLSHTSGGKLVTTLARLFAFLYFGIHSSRTLQLSHLCHHSSCLRLNHLILEAAAINNSRRSCFRSAKAGTAFICPHQPKCLLRH